MKALFKKIYRFLDNYWYHYRWITLIAAFFIVVGAVLIVQYASRDRFDASVIYAGPKIQNAAALRDMEKAFESAAGDYDENGEVNIQITDYLIMTDEQAREIQKEADAEELILFYNAKELENNKNEFTTQIFVGESLICLLDPEQYRVVADEGGFCPLEDILGYLPDCAADEYSAVFSQTEFYKAHGVFTSLPEDTLICFREMSSTAFLKNKNKEKKRYEYNKEIFRSIMEDTKW